MRQPVRASGGRADFTIHGTDTVSIFELRNPGLTAGEDTERVDEQAGRPSRRVTIVLPMRNAEQTIVAALDSIAAQTWRDSDLVLCDDASNDRSVEIAEKWLAANPSISCRLLELEGCGPAEARNRGIAVARGEYIAFLDDDDTWDPTKLERCMEAVDRDGLDLICHAERWVDDEGRSQVRRYSQLFDRRLAPVVSLLRNNPFSTSAVVVRRSRLEEAGPFDPSLPSAEDYDQWIRLAMLPGMRIGFIDDPLGTYRVRSGSESSAIDRRIRALGIIGDRYGAAAARASRVGRLELWMYRAKVHFTSGVRYYGQGHRILGLALMARGFLMWPFRLDWLRAYARRSTDTAPTVPGPEQRSLATSQRGQG